MGRRGASLGAACAGARSALVAGPAQAAVTTVEASYRVAVERNVVVPMTDGTPYRKELRAAEGAGFIAARGFVHTTRPIGTSFHTGERLAPPSCCRSPRGRG